jgi:hypothetical protein
VVALVDSLGNLVKFRLIPSQYHNIEVIPLIENIDFEAFLLADKTLDANFLLKKLK